MKIASYTALIFALGSIAASAAPATTPGFTAFDQRQFAKLSVGVGTWNCVDTPASKKPDVTVTKQAGNYFVSTETGDNPNVTYTRWSHTLQEYTSVSMAASGGVTVYVTKDSDPNNATWSPAWPQGTGTNKLLPGTVKTSGNTVTSVFAYYDAKGKLQNGKSVCTKQ